MERTQSRSRSRRGSLRTRVLRDIGDSIVGTAQSAVKAIKSYSRRPKVGIANNNNATVSRRSRTKPQSRKSVKSRMLNSASSAVSKSYASLRDMLSRSHRVAPPPNVSRSQMNHGNRVNTPRGRSSKVAIVHNAGQFNELNGIMLGFNQNPMVTTSRSTKLPSGPSPYSGLVPNQLRVRRNASNARRVLSGRSQSSSKTSSRESSTRR
jgi:hypothetical protein